MKMNFVHSIFFIFILVTFVAGLIFYIRPNTPYYKSIYEMMDNMDDETEETQENPTGEIVANPINVNANVANPMIVDTTNVDTDVANPMIVDTDVANNETDDIENNPTNIETDDADAPVVYPTYGVTKSNKVDSIIIRPINTGLAKNQNIQTLGVTQYITNPIQNSNAINKYNAQNANIPVDPSSIRLKEQEKEIQKGGKKYNTDKEEDTSIVQTGMNVNAYSKRSIFGGAPHPYGDMPAIGPTPFDLNYQPISPNNPPNGMDPSEMEMEKGSPSNPVKVKNAAYENSPYNQNMHYAFDPTSQYVGQYTNIDALHDSTANSMDDEMGASYSDNPMDANWGGVEWTRKSIESGKYDDDLVIPYNQANGLTESTRSKKIPVNRFA
jgi:hypothetical protein